MFDGKADDALQLRLGNVNDPAVADVLAQKHTEVGRGHGRCLIRFRQIYKGKRGVRADKETLLPRRGFYCQKKLVRLGLYNLRDPSI